MNYEVIVSSVHSRADLLDGTMRSMLPCLDMKPSRIIIHEDVKRDEPFEPGHTEQIVANLIADFGIPVKLIQTNPGTGLGRAMLRLFHESTTEFVLYTQEDFDFLRTVPITACLSTMAHNKLNHVRFNKRKTMKCKGADRAPHEQFHKVEVTFPVGASGMQTFCVSDHWYFQASLWRRDIGLEGFQALDHRCEPNRMIDRCEAAFNLWFNLTYGKGAGSTDPTAANRLELCKTFIWGGIGEPAFIKHTGHDRRSQGWSDPGKRDPNS